MYKSRKNNFNRSLKVKVQVNMKLRKFVSIGIALVLGASASILSASRVLAAEKIVLTFGPIRQTINISDLEDFAKEGTTTPTIQQIVRFSKIEPEVLRGFIGLEVGLKPANLARIVYSTPGEKIIDEIGQVIRTQRRTENGKALRAALILSASNDSKVSLLQILKKYPLPEVYVDVAGIGGAVEKVQGLAGELVQGFLGGMQSTTESPSTESPIAPSRTIVPITPTPARAYQHPYQHQHRSL